MNKFTILFLSALVCFEYSYGAPGIHNALLYLSRFGYIEPSTRINSSKNGALMDEKSYVKAIEEFQSFAGLEVTGNLDKQTVTAMSLPRCGVKDIVGTGSSRSKRYALQGSRWKVKNLKYRITKYPAKLKRSAVDKTVQDAFNVWTEYTDLVFSPSSGSKVHIDIRFERGEHGDGDPFDGPGGTLAHAFFPVYGGDAHFDASEQWTIDSYSGTNLFQVAAHEFGHSLGLSHSDVRSALMAPFYRGYDPAFNLDEDDVTAIQSLYGHKTRKSDKPDDFDSGYDDTKHINKKVPAPTPNSDENLCKSPKMDTIFTTPEDDATFMFKGGKFWKLEEKAIASGYPKAISEGWPGLPNNIDAAFGHQNGKTYFFKGSKYWRYKGRVMENGYPKEISEGFTGIPDNVDAALVWSGNGKIYFFKGAKFWRFDPTSKPPVKSTYPKPIANWEGVPDNLDAAFKWSNGYTYFFKNGAYYRFNDRSFAVDSDPVPFPRSVEYWWYGCSGAPEGTVGTKNYQRRPTH